MKIVFINLSLRPGSKRRHFPVGLAYIMTAVKKAGFYFDLIDMDINQITIQHLEELLGKKEYDIYALGCIVTGFKILKKITEIIRSINPNAIIIAGNSVASSIPEVLLRNTKVDIAVIGEGDITIIELLKSLESKKELSAIKGIAFKENGRVMFPPKRSVIPNIDTVGFPDWDIFELDKYNQYGKINTNYSSVDEMVLSYPLNSARGCIFNCTFCYHVFKKEQFRRYTEELIMEEVNRLYYKYHCNFISFWDELTFPNIKSVENRIDSLSKLKFNILWEAPIRANLFKREHLDLIRSLKGVGCDNLAFSLENADQEILRAMNKKLTVAQFIEQANVLQEGGVTPLTSVIFGYPQETPETIKHTLEVCAECNIYPSVGFLLPLPGTPIYEWAKNNGYISDEVGYLERIGDRQDFHINLTKMSDKEFIFTVESGLKDLAQRQGLKLDSVFKTVTYQKPKQEVKTF